MMHSANISPLRMGVLAVLALFTAYVGHGTLEAAPIFFETSEITVITVHGRFNFAVEVAKTDAQRSQGLQYRTEMAGDAGMLFDFGRVQAVAMWMKNTFIPLDMVFISHDGHVVGIAENTTPESLEIIQSGKPVLGVLEVRAGTAARLGITKGSLVMHPMFAATPEAGKAQDK